MEYPRISFIRLIMTKRKLQASPKFRFFADVAVQDQKRRKKYVAVEDEKSDTRSVTTKDFRTGATVISRVSMRTIWETSRSCLPTTVDSLSWIPPLWVCRLAPVPQRTVYQSTPLGLGESISQRPAQYLRKDGGSETTQQSVNKATLHSRASLFWM